MQILIRYQHSYLPQLFFLHDICNKNKDGCLEICLPAASYLETLHVTHTAK